MTPHDPRDLPNVPPAVLDARPPAARTGWPHLDELLAEVAEHGHSPTWRDWRDRALAGVDRLPPRDAEAVKRMLTRAADLLGEGA